MQDLAELQTRLREAGYIAEKSLAAALSLVLRLKRPLLIEGDAGVGKTEVAKALAGAFDRTLIRLQCYEGLDVNSAVYEWNYQRQLLAIKIQESARHSADETERHIFGPEFLLKRPLLAAITQVEPAPPAPSPSRSRARSRRRDSRSSSRGSGVSARRALRACGSR